jgi:hypothetical protein
MSVTRTEVLVTRDMPATTQFDNVGAVAMRRVVPSSINLVQSQLLSCQSVVDPVEHDNDNPSVLPQPRLGLTTIY